MIKGDKEMIYVQSKILKSYPTNMEMRPVVFLDTVVYVCAMSVMVLLSCHPEKPYCMSHLRIGRGGKLFMVFNYTIQYYILVLTLGPDVTAV